MAQTMNYLSEHKLLDYKVLSEKTAAATARFLSLIHIYYSQYENQRRDGCAKKWRAVAHQPFPLTGGKAENQSLNK